MVIAAHAERENHYAFSRTKSEISYVSNLQDKHNASYFLKYLNPAAERFLSLGKAGNPAANLTKISEDKAIIVKK